MQDLDISGKEERTAPASQRIAGGSPVFTADHSADVESLLGRRF